ncbi:hypothetical protein ACN28E_54295 [Archangium lansingense]|uniref:hypothetical protein n=1 Tax=Archangium lansingense TaxID=2995310 RepID=UPI003B7B4042
MRTRLTSRPKATVARPPTAAPMKSMVPQTLPRAAWAMGSCSGGTTLGPEASATGSKKEERAAAEPGRPVDSVTKPLMAT